MKTNLVLACLLVLLTTAGFDCINEPLDVALQIDPITGCYTVTPGSGSFSGQTEATVRNLIPSDFQEKLKGLRVYDIRVRVSGPYPAGNVSGVGNVQLDYGTGYGGTMQVLTFSGPYSSFAAGVSLLNSGGLIQGGTGLAQFLAAMSNVSNLPQKARLSGSGTGPAPTQSFQVCIEILFQADANARD